MSELKKSLTYAIIEEYGNEKNEVIVDIVKGKFTNLKGELIQYNEATKTGIVLVQMSEHLSLIRELELGFDFEFKKNNELDFEKLDKVDLDLEDIIILILEYFYLHSPLLYKVSQKTSKTFECPKEFPPYLFKDSILLSNKKKYQIYFECGTLVLFQNILASGNEKKVKILEYEVNPELFIKSMEYDSLRHNTIKNVSLVFFNNNFTKLNGIIEKSEKYLRQITKGYIQEATNLISLITEDES